jgi:hypothetical protein
MEDKKYYLITTLHKQYYSKFSFSQGFANCVTDKHPLEELEYQLNLVKENFKPGQEVFPEQIIIVFSMEISKEIYEKYNNINRDEGFFKFVTFLPFGKGR